MSRRSVLYPYAIPSPDPSPVFEALAEVMATAATYADTARQFAEIRDPRGAAYAVRSCAAALMTAAELVEEIRPSRQSGEQAA